MLRNKNKAFRRYASIFLPLRESFLGWAMLRLRVAGRDGGAQSVGSTAERARAKFAGVTSKP